MPSRYVLRLALVESFVQCDHCLLAYLTVCVLTYVSGITLVACWVQRCKHFEIGGDSKKKSAVY